MIEKPRARIYWEKNFHGASEDLNITKQQGMCQQLHKLHGNARSVETYGSCIRVFRKQGCSGWSLAIYPGSNNSRELLTERLRRAESVGPCLDNEFIFASFEDPTKRTIVKNPKFSKYMPDLVEFGSDIGLIHKRPIASYYIDNMKYLVEWKNRVEYLYFILYPKKRHSSNSDTLTLQNSKFYKSLKTLDGNEITFAIPLSIGASTNKTFNIFPASRNCVEKWNRIISNFNFDQVIIKINFAYESDNSTRPLFFYYHIDHEQNDSYWYGRILNGNNLKINLDAKPQIIVHLKPKTKTLRLPPQQLHQIFKNWTNDSTDFNSNSTLPNFNKPMESLCWDMDCQMLQNFEDIQGIPEIANGSLVPKDYIQDMTGEIPFAVFYSGQNYTGNSSKVLFSSHVSRHYIYYLLDETRMGSVETFGKCIRLYASNEPDDYLGSSSLAVYPGSDNSHAVLQFGLSGFTHIGHCSPSEFLNSTFSHAGKRHISKNRTSIYYIPDLADKHVLYYIAYWGM